MLGTDIVIEGDFGESCEEICVGRRGGLAIAEERREDDEVLKRGMRFKCEKRSGFSLVDHLVGVQGFVLAYEPNVIRDGYLMVRFERLRMLACMLTS